MGILLLNVPIIQIGLNFLIEKLIFCKLSEIFWWELYYYFHNKKIKRLWLQFAQCLKTKCGITIDVTPETCILELLSGDNFNIINTKMYFHNYKNVIIKTIFYIYL